MENLTHLREVMATEAELSEQLLQLMKMQQQALVQLDSITVEQTVEREQELLLPLEALEQERVRLTKEIMTVLAPQRQSEEPVHLNSLMSMLSAEDAHRLSDVRNRLYQACDQVQKINYANKYLIEHSRRFVNETFRIVTNGYSRKLIDHKI